MKLKKTALQQYLDKTPNATSYQSTKYSPYSADSQFWNTEFPNSKAECINQLHRIKQKLRGEEQAITYHLRGHQDSILRQLDSEYQELRAEICKEIDKIYEQNKLKVKIGFANNGLREVNDLTQQLRGLYFRVQSLLRELETGATYKRGIAETVMEDFQNKRRMISATKQSVLSKYQNYQFLRVDMNVFQSIRQSISRLFIYEDGQISDLGFKSTANFGGIANYDFNDRQPQTEFSQAIKITPPADFPSILKKPIMQNIQMQNLPSPAFLQPEIPPIQNQPFSFQPSQASQNMFQSPNSPTKKMRQSSAQQFRNSYSRHFNSQFENPYSRIAQSHVRPFTRQQFPPQEAPYVNPHRNRDLIKKQF